MRLQRQQDLGQLVAERLPAQHEGWLPIALGIGHDDHASAENASQLTARVVAAPSLRISLRIGAALDLSDPVAPAHVDESRVTYS